jgi:aminodeoxyfutalosine deaminase
VPDQKFDEFIKKSPKAELHLHLEGSIRPQTAVELIRRYNPDSPNLSKRQVNNFYSFNSLPEFISGMRTVSQNIRTLKDLERVTGELIDSLHAQNVRYVEFDCALQKYLDRGFNLDDIVESIYESTQHHSLVAKMIVNLQRDHDPDNALTLVQNAAKLNHPFIVGVGLSGDETRYPPHLFSYVFDFAREVGFHLTAHAGEAAGVESIWGALKHLKIERIDHGTRAIEDEKLIAHLVEHQISLTQCLTSNIKLNVVDSIDDHPFGYFYRRGIPVTLNTDDPEVFQVSLTQEYKLAGESFDLSEEDMEKIVLNTIDASFADKELKAKLDTEIREEFETLKVKMAYV